MRTYRYVAQTIPAKRYVELINTLIHQAKQCKTRVRFRHLPPLGGEFLPNNVSGTCDKELITVTMYGKPLDREVLYTLAHELRHAQHKKYGMFGNYYKYTTMNNVFKNLVENLKAERECDRFALRWLNIRGVPYYLARTYSAENMNLIRWLALSGVDSDFLDVLCEEVERRVGG